MKCRNILCDSHVKHPSGRCLTYFDAASRRDCYRRKMYNRIVRAKRKGADVMEFQWKREHYRYYRRER